MYLLNAVIYAVCALLWLKDGDMPDFIIAAVWLAGSILNLIKYLKERKFKEE